MSTPVERVENIEARIQQLENLLGPVNSSATPPNLSLSPLSKAPSVSKESFETALNRTVGNRPAAGVPPLPVTLEPAPGTMNAESLPLDPDESRRRQLYLPYIREAAASTGLPETLIAAVIQAESSFKPETVSSAGAMGLMQLMPDNVRELGVKDPFDPRENILAGARHLRDMVTRFGSLENALAAYNAGPGNVTKYHGIPPFTETRNYVQRITTLLQRAGALEGVQSMISGSAPEASSRIKAGASSSSSAGRLSAHAESGRFTEALDSLKERRRAERVNTRSEQGGVTPLILPPPTPQENPTAPAKASGEAPAVDSRESTQAVDSKDSTIQGPDTAAEAKETTPGVSTLSTEAELAGEPVLFSASLDRQIAGATQKSEAAPVPTAPSATSTGKVSTAIPVGLVTPAAFAQPTDSATVPPEGSAASSVAAVSTRQPELDSKMASMDLVEIAGKEPAASTVTGEKPIHSTHTEQGPTAEAAPDVSAPAISETQSAPARGTEVSASAAMEAAPPSEAAAELAEVAARLREGVRGRAPGERVVVRVMPRTLGAMELHVERALDGGLNVRVVTETRQAAELLQREQGPLTEALAQNGLSLNTFSTALSDQRSEPYQTPAEPPTQAKPIGAVSSTWAPREQERPTRMTYGRLDFHA